jgi:hypothetical protein
MGWVECQSAWVFGPDFAEVFVGREAVKGLESSGKVVGSEEVGQVRFELVTLHVHLVASSRQQRMAAHDTESLRELPKMSNCYCLSGRAGGTPDWISWPYC